MGKSVIVVLPLALLLIASGQAVAQTPPTATEAFNLRIRCKQMTDQKAEALAWHEMNCCRWCFSGNVCR